MTISISTHRAPTRFGGWLDRAGLALTDIGEMTAQWRLRARTRRELAGLDKRMLADIGLDRATARQEAEKPFWR